MKKTTFILLGFLSFSSCVQQSEHDKVKLENQKLKNELDELENGAERLYAQAVEFANNNELDKADEKLKILFDKHNETQQAKDGRTLQSEIQEQRKVKVENENWATTLSSNTIESYESYVQSYPNGKYVANSKANISKIKIEQEMEDYNNAINSNSSQTVREFIDKYPNHQNITKFRKKLIQLEVDDIFGDRNTGQLPKYDRIGYEYSATSTIDINNDTGCELVVRYSGDDIKMIVIPSGRSKSITLSSGNYRIAASACGANYAGTEDLQGNYSSKYYISATRY